MIEIMPGIAVSEAEIGFKAVRSGGPGGQNVNKVSSKVILTFDVARSAALSDEQKQRITEKLSTRMSKEGTLQIVSQRTRSQELNRADALNRFSDLLRRALTPERRRIKTGISGTQRAKRLEEKRKRAVTKQARSKPGCES
jgi:ribosome-associated protein